MHTSIVMKKALLFSLITITAANCPVVPVRAGSNQNHVRIVELQTGGTQDATEEFVELYNPGDTTINVTGWLLQYRPASGLPGQSWASSSTKATIACAQPSLPDCTVEIAPASRIVLVHTIANIAGSYAMNGGFSDKGGQIRLIQPGASPVVHDFIGYGTAADSETAPAPAPSAGQSIKRVLDVEGVPIDTNDNHIDFVAACGAPSPGQDDSSTIPYVSGCEVPQSEPTPEAPNPDTPPTTEPTEPPAETPETTAPTYLPVLITELLPNPASPQTDSNDEFIELYNPNDTAITLSGYRLQTGADYRYTYTLGDTPLGPHAYLAIPSAVSKLSLANSGSGVRLMDPGNAVAAEVLSYGNAPEGQSWMQDETGWHWTLTPTPSTANTLTTPAPKAATAASPTKKTAAAKTSVPKIATPKAVAAAKAPAAKKTASPATTAGSAPTQKSPAIQYWLLIPLATLAIGYVIYEYRENIARAGRKLWAGIRKKPPITEND